MRWRRRNSAGGPHIVLPGHLSDSSRVCSTNPCSAHLLLLLLKYLNTFQFQRFLRGPSDLGESPGGQQRKMSLLLQEYAQNCKRVSMQLACTMCTDTSLLATSTSTQAHSFAVAACGRWHPVLVHHLAKPLRTHPDCSQSTSAFRPASWTTQVAMHVAMDSPRYLFRLPCPFYLSFRRQPLIFPSSSAISLAVFFSFFFSH